MPIIKVCYNLLEEDFKGDNNPMNNDYDIKVVQNEILKIMKELHKILTENNFKYYLCGGSVLGAIRHNGFIPWDDDLDIMMPREDYDRFIKNASEILPDYLYLQGPSNCNEAPLMFHKVRKKNTLFEEKINRGLKYPKGIFVDIFPLDSTDDNGKRFFRKMKKVRFYKKIYLFQRRKDGKHRLVQLISHLIPRKFCVKRVTKLCVNKEATKFYFESLSQYPIHKVIYTQDVIGDGVLHKFEDTEFYIPTNYDKYLSTKFGDYMKLPPVEKRGIQHDVVRLLLNYDDSEYFK